jgi:hypothetical protein
VNRPGERGTPPPGGPQDEDRPHTDQGAQGEDGLRSEEGAQGEDGPRSEEGALGGVDADDGGGGTLSQVSITVDEEHLGSLDQVVQALRERGMHVDSVLEGLGMVTGSTPDPAALREVEGVSGVDAELEFRIPPPEDEIQ